MNRFSDYGQRAVQAAKNNKLPIIIGIVIFFIIVIIVVVVLVFVLRKKQCETNADCDNNMICDKDPNDPYKMKCQIAPPPTNNQTTPQSQTPVASNHFTSLPFSSNYDFHYYGTVSPGGDLYDLKKEGPGYDPKQCIQECASNENCKSYCAGPDGCHLSSKLFNPSDNGKLFSMSGGTWNCESKFNGQVTPESITKFYLGSSFDKTKATGCDPQKCSDGCIRCNDYLGKDSTCYQFNTLDQFKNALTDTGDITDGSLWVCEGKK